MRPLLALAIAAALAGAACDREEGGHASPAPPSSDAGTPSPAPRPSIEEAPGARLPAVPPQRLLLGEAAEVMAELCVPPELLVDADPPEAGATSPAIAEVERQVAEIRDLDWRRPVIAQPIDDHEMDRRISEAFELQFPAAQYDRRTLAWRTIGALGPDEDLHAALLAFGRGQVVGYYNPQDGELVYLDDDDDELGLTEKAVLAHELTHAIDDQHFDLRRIDTLASQCRDEEFTAALAAVEGSAQHFSMQVLLRYPAPVDAGIIGALTQGTSDDLPAFVAQLQLLPYTVGQAFVSSLASDGGSEAVDAALEDWPTTTEQVLHPERWPDDEPTPIDLPDLIGRGGPALGDGWRDFDVMQVGELWLRELLALRLEEADAEGAAAGWDGGAYRAWRDGGRVAVVLRTAWDTGADAEGFADAMTRWLDAGSTVGQAATGRGRIVDVVFASDASTLASLVGD